LCKHFCWVYVAFAMDNVALGQVFLWVLQFFPVSIIPPWLFIHICHLGNEQQAHWWVKFRGIVSPHQHEQQLGHLKLICLFQYLKSLYNLLILSSVDEIYCRMIVNNEYR
jgi:hypothetical protein